MTPGCMCEADDRRVVHVYESPPEGETRFEVAAYRRELLHCETCGHFVTAHDLDLADLYAGEYSDATYGATGLRTSFDRIMALPPGSSDNEGRAARLDAFVAARLQRPIRALDVGSGLGVFPARMQRAGWDIVALDPDSGACDHLRDHVGVEAICADFFRFEPLAGRRYDVVTLNKVLEHVEDPVAMLRRVGDVLATDGIVYVELPDGTEAFRDGPGREEFFLEHWHVFSMASVALLAERAGFTVLQIERLREPSDKYTIRAFLTPPVPVTGGVA